MRYNMSVIYIITKQRTHTIHCYIHYNITKNIYNSLKISTWYDIFTDNDSCSFFSYKRYIWAGAFVSHEIVLFTCTFTDV